MKATQRLFWNADKSKLLPEGHRDAATLYAAPGDEIPQSMVERFKLTDGQLPSGRKSKQPDDNPGSAAGASKQAKPDEDKSVPSPLGGEGRVGGSGLTVNKAKKGA